MMYARRCELCFTGQCCRLEAHEHATYRSLSRSAGPRVGSRLSLGREQGSRQEPDCSSYAVCDP